MKRARERISEEKAEERKKKRSSAWERQAPLRQYEQQVLGVDFSISKTEQIGEFQNKKESIDTVEEKEDATIQAHNEEERALEETINDINLRADNDAKRRGLPTAAELASTGFGKPSRDHSFTQEASGETIVFTFLKYGSQYLNNADKESLLNTHPLIKHISKMIKAFQQVDFTPLREYDRDYASRKEIPKERIMMFMACLFHYDLKHRQCNEICREQLHRSIQRHPKECGTNERLSR